uniref:Uncharacterized protein n=1 Tax=Tetraselmis chuii TaxID=63592 RepID=A0A7S1T338_9CHLO
MGTAEVQGRRQLQPTLVQGAWTSSTVATAMVRILTQELLGYEPAVISSTDSLAAVLECNGVDMEVWGTGRGEDAELRASNVTGIRTSYLGAVARRGLYAPIYTPYTLAHFHALLTVDERKPPQQRYSDDGGGLLTQNISKTTDYFPADGTITNANISRWCSDSGAQSCCTNESARDDAQGWNVSTHCVNGRWYPPQCGVDSVDAFPSANCRELYLPDVTWSDGWYEALIANRGWNFSAVYVGRAGMVELLAAMIEQRQDFLYSWWEPESLHLRYPSQRVVLPEHTRACEQSYQPDPLLSGVDCGEKELLL